MFYAQFVLSKKGPLSKIWLAAHFEKKLTKAQVLESNVQDAVDEVMKPKVKLSLRTTGHLLLGIVRINARKAHYVMEDCREAMYRIKMTFRSGAVDLALPAGSRADERPDPLDGDLPEPMNDIYDALLDINDFETGSIGHMPTNQSRIDDITLREDNFETSSQRNLGFNGELGLDDFGEREQQNFSNMGLDDDFGDGGSAKLDFSGLEEGRRNASLDARGSFMRTGADGSLLVEDEPTRLKGAHHADDLPPDDFGDYAPAQDLDMLLDYNDLNQELDLAGSVAPANAPGEEMDVDQIVPQNNNGVNGTQESFTLEPLDTAALEQQAHEKQARQRRKRRLVVDEYKNIKGDDMKANMSNYTDTMHPLDLAPPTKLLMRLRENGTVERLFTLPGCADAIMDPCILRLYQSHLVLFVRDDDENLSDDIRREMELADNLDDEVYSHIDDDLGPNSPMQAAQFGENEVDENQEPFDGLPLAANCAKTPAQINSSLVEDKRTSSARRSRVHEAEEENGEDDDEELFTRRTKNILNSIAQKLRASESDQIFFHDILTRGTRRTAAQKFYALLELHKRHAIYVEQADPFGPISIRSGQNLDETLALTPQ